MKKLLTILLLFVSVAAFGQGQTYYHPGRPTGSHSVSPTWLEIPGDSLTTKIYLGIGGNQFWQMPTWPQMRAAIGGGGGGSTGINGLNGTTNIGLGGTLLNNTYVQNNGFVMQFDSLQVLNAPVNPNNVVRLSDLTTFNPTLYSGDGSLAYHRSVNQQDFNLQFSGTNTYVEISPQSYDANIYLDYFDGAGSSYLSMQSGQEILDSQIGSGTAYFQSYGNGFTVALNQYSPNYYKLITADTTIANGIQVRDDFGLHGMFYVDSTYTSTLGSWIPDLYAVKNLIAGGSTHTIYNHDDSLSNLGITGGFRHVSLGSSNTVELDFQNAAGDYGLQISSPGLNEAVEMFYNEAGSGGAINAITFVNPYEWYAAGTTPTYNSQFNLYANSWWVTSVNVATGYTKQIRADTIANGIVVYDDFNASGYAPPTNGNGMFYHYNTYNSTDPRWLTSKGYVDSAITANISGIIYAHGLTRLADTVSLGGTLAYSTSGTVLNGINGAISGTDPMFSINGGATGVVSGGLAGSNDGLLLSYFNEASILASDGFGNVSGMEVNINAGPLNKLIPNAASIFYYGGGGAYSIAASSTGVQFGGVNSGTPGTPTSAYGVDGSGNLITYLLSNSQTALVAGTKAVTITGVTTGSHAIAGYVSQGGTVVAGTLEAVCTTNTVTVTAKTTSNTTNTLDTSTVNIIVTY